MASVTMERINAEWKAYVSKNPNVFRWVSSKNSEPGKVPPRRQLEWKASKSKIGETKFQVAFESENNRWVLYTFRGDRTNAKELVTCNIAVWKVFTCWMLSKETLLGTVANTFLARYEGITIRDVQWLISKFRCLGAEDINSRKGKLERQIAYKNPKSFSLVSKSFTPTFAIDGNANSPSANIHGGAQKTNASVPVKIADTHVSSRVANAAEGRDAIRNHIALKQMRGDSPAASKNKCSLSKVQEAETLRQADVSEVTKFVGSNAATKSQKVSAVGKQSQTSRPHRIRCFEDSSSLTGKHEDNNSEEDESEFDEYGFSTRGDEHEEKYDEYETQTSAKWKSSRIFRLPVGAKETCVYENDYPKNFKVGTDSVKSYILKDINGDFKAKFFVVKPNCDWIEYIPSLNQKRRRGRQVSGTKSKRPRLADLEHEQATRLDEIYHVPDRYGGYEVEEQVTTVDEHGQKTCNVKIIDMSHAREGPQPKPVPGKGTYTMSREKYIASYNSGYRP
ncbi:hypothetical protein BKA65DRAFT_547373 [Rhexocercosporidium sp. MPI-PUGE-AT-0058]|nr:hypothetical protein BKA65DRAFT_547373 [Rhexocercosporidium sp. MPI-PUGE-AT-0058]